MLGALVPALAVGCGSVKPAGGGDAGVEMPPLTADAACAQFAQAYCDALAACATVAIPLYFEDATNCVTRMKLSCMTDQMAPGIDRTPDDVAACAHDASSAMCADLVAGRLPASCQVKPGTAPNGGACGSSWQCASTHCEKASNATCGTCAVRQPANGDCTVDEGCTAGLVCASGKCAAPVGLGAACDSKTPCRSDLYCDKTSQVCTGHVGAAASCASDSNACDILNGYGCNPFTHVCQSIGVAQGGEPCGLVNGTLVVCVVLDACPGASLTQAGACVSPAQDGTACNDNSHCLPPASCVNQLCRLPSSNCQ
jgi:hypothetical protein